MLNFLVANRPPKDTTKDALSTCQAKKMLQPSAALAAALVGCHILTGFSLFLQLLIDELT